MKYNIGKMECNRFRQNNSHARALSTAFDRGKREEKRKIKHVCKMERHVLKYKTTMDNIVQEDVFYGLQINL